MPEAVRSYRKLDGHEGLILINLNAQLRAIVDGLLVAWKFLRSFLKRDWGLEDYPVRVDYFPDVLKREVFNGQPLQMELHPNVIDRQLRDPPWSGTWLAYVVNWPEMARFGNSPEDALRKLGEHLIRLQAAAESLPRPGTSVPFVQAPTHRMAEHTDLAADFFQRILDRDHRRHWVSDLADLKCFHDEPTNDPCVEKILLVYGVDVSDIADRPLVAIFERLVASGAWRGPG